MTIALGAAVGNSQNKTAATSITHSVTADVTLGSYCIFAGVCDNLATVDGETNDHTTVTDTQSNTWRKLREQTNTVGGAAGDGVTVSIWISRITTLIPVTTGVITANFSGSVTAKNWGAAYYTCAAGSTIALASLTVANQDASTNGPSTTFSGLVSRAYTMIAVDGFETTQTSFALTQDADYASRINNGTTGGLANTNVKLLISDRINATLTTDTHLATSGLTSDSAGILATFVEVPDLPATALSNERRAMAPQIRGAVW